MVLARRIARLGKPFPPAIITLNRVREQPTLAGTEWSSRQLHWDRDLTLSCYRAKTTVLFALGGECRWARPLTCACTDVTVRSCVTM